MDAGDFRLGKTFDVKFTTIAADGVPTTLAGSPAVAAYPDNSTTEITAGITLSVDFDSRTGLNNVRVVATGGNGYATATNYVLVLTAGTVDGTSVAGYVVGHFSIEARSALMPTTADRTLLVESDGMAHADAREWLGGTIATPTVTGVPEVDVTHWIGTAAATPTVAGVPEVDVTHWVGATTVPTNVTVVFNTDFASNYNTTADRWKVDLTHANGTAVSATDAVPASVAGYNIVNGTIGATGNDTTHLHLDGLTYGNDEIVGYGIVIRDVSESEYHFRFIDDWVLATELATVTTLPFTPENSVDTYWVVALQEAAGGSAPTALEVADAVWDEARAGHVAGGSFGEGVVVNSIAASAITATSIASDAITAAKIATGAIDADAIAADAIGSAEFAQAAADKIWASATRSLTTVSGLTIDANVTAIAASGVNDLFDVDSATTYDVAVEGSLVKEIQDAFVNTAVVVGSIQPSAINEAAFATIAGTFAPLGIIDQGTAQSATSTTVVLRAAAAFADNTLAGAQIMAFGSTQGYWQTRKITANTLSSDTVTVAAWTVTPSGTITYKIFRDGPEILSRITTAIPNVAFSTSGGLMILGTNTAGVSLQPASGSALDLRGGSDTAVYILGANNGQGIYTTGDGTGAGIRSDGGASGAGISATAGVPNQDIFLGNAESDSLAAAIWQSGVQRSLTALGFPLTSSDFSSNWLTAAGAAADFSTEVNASVLAAIAALNNVSNASVATAVLTTAMTEAYRSAGATATLAQFVYEVIAHLGEATIAGTTKTLKKLDGSTTAKTYTLDSATTPTSITETT